MSDAMAMMRAQLEAEQRFIDERGGQRWIDAYIKPYYRKWMGLGAYRPDALALIADVRDRAAELSVDDLNLMVGMQWRIQVMGTWYAIARADDAFSAALHGAFKVCYGTLTAPALATAVLTYPNESTEQVLRAYLDRDIAHQYGAAGFVRAALRRLELERAEGTGDRDDEAVSALLNVTSELQSSQ